MQLISVVLASGWGSRGRSGKWTDTKAVLNHGFDNYAYETIIQEEDQAGVVSVTRSRTSELHYNYSAGLIIPLSNDETVEVSIEVPASVQAPISKGEVIGKAAVYINKQLYTEIELHATDEAQRHDLKTFLEKVLNQYLSQVLNEPVQLVLPEF